MEHKEPKDRSHMWERPLRDDEQPVSSPAPEPPTVAPAEPSPEPAPAEPQTPDEPPTVH